MTNQGQKTGFAPTTNPRSVLLHTPRPSTTSEVDPSFGRIRQGLDRCDNTVQYSTVPYSTVPYSTMQYGRSSAARTAASFVRVSCARAAAPRMTATSLIALCLRRGKRRFQSSQWCESASDEAELSVEPLTSTSQPLTSTSQPLTSTSQPLTSTAQPLTSTSQPLTSRFATERSTQFFPWQQGRGGARGGWRRCECNPPGAGCDTSVTVPAPGRLDAQRRLPPRVPSRPLPPPHRRPPHPRLQERDTSVTGANAERDTTVTRPLPPPHRRPPHPRLQERDTSVTGTAAERDTSVTGATAERDTTVTRPLPPHRRPPHPRLQERDTTVTGATAERDTTATGATCCS
eukprot:1194803-Prorocentrum_minimum.AAC.1